MLSVIRVVLLVLTVAAYLTSTRPSSRERVVHVELRQWLRLFAIRAGLHLDIVADEKRASPHCQGLRSPPNKRR